MRRSDRDRSTWLPEDDAPLEYAEAMRNLYLSTVAALALSSCAPDGFHAHKAHVGREVYVGFGAESQAQGTLQPDGTLKTSSGKLVTISWDKVTRVVSAR
ncbi:hypothetical protein N9261_00555 [bacterium]|nr:hypothetical protein [bacterium]